MHTRADNAEKIYHSHLHNANHPLPSSLLPFSTPVPAAAYVSAHAAPSILAPASSPTPAPAPIPAPIAVSLLFHPTLPALITLMQ